MLMIFDIGSGQVLRCEQAQPDQDRLMKMQQFPQVQLQLAMHPSREERPFTTGPVIADLNAYFRHMG